jgi:hypothetical protein
MTDIPSLIRGARLEGIDIVRCTWERDHPDVHGPLKYPASVTQHINLMVRQPDQVPAGAAAFLIVMNVRWTEEGQPPEARAVAGGEVHIRVAYAFADSSVVVDADTAREFGKSVALHQAWPYLRHRLQLLCMELGINPVLLPLKPLTSTPQSGPDDEPPGEGS